MVDWAFGAVHVKIAVAFTLLGPNWWLRDALENIYNQESFIMRRSVGSLRRRRQNLYENLKKGARNFQLKNSRDFVS